jgi:hypothetical protein
MMNILADAHSGWLVNQASRLSEEYGNGSARKCDVNSERISRHPNMNCCTLCFSF